MGISKGTGQQVAQSPTAKIIGRLVDTENAALAVEPTLADLASVMQQLRAKQLELKSLARELPERAQAWLVPYCIDNLFERIFRRVAVETQNIVAGQSPGDFSEFMSSAFLSGVEMFATVEATLNGGGVGRRMYRVCDGAISGLNGLTLHEGDEIALLVEHRDTQKFLASGNLTLVERAQ